MKKTTFAFLALSFLPAIALAHGDEAHEKAEKHTHKDGTATAALAGHVATLTATEGGIHVTVKEKDGKAPDAATEPKLTLKMGKDSKDVALEGAEGDYHAAVDLKNVPKFVAVLSIKLDGKLSTARFDVHGLAKDASDAPKATPAESTKPAPEAPKTH